MLEQVTLTGTGNIERGAIAAALSVEFPSVFVSFDGARDAVPPHLRASEWSSATFDFWDFDCQVDALSAAESFALQLDDDRGGGAAFPLEVLCRCQRAVGRRNRHSSTQLFDRVLRVHRRLFNLDRPLVRADFNHALDVWQWVLRVDRDASLALQIAALFHDIERLASEPDERIEQYADDYQQFKDEHARRGAEIAALNLRDAGVAEPVIDEVARLIVAHENPPEGRTPSAQRGVEPRVSNSPADDHTTLADADALSFFSLNSSGYADYFGPEQTLRKVTWTLNRMSAAAHERLQSMRLRHDVHALLHHA